MLHFSRGFSRITKRPDYCSTFLRPKKSQYIRFFFLPKFISLLHAFNMVLKHTKTPHMRAKNIPKKLIDHMPEIFFPDTPYINIF